MIIRNIYSLFDSICHRKEKGQDVFGLFIIAQMEIHNIIRVGKHETSTFTHIKVIICSLIFIL